MARLAEYAEVSLGILGVSWKLALGCMWEHMQFFKDHFKYQPGYEGYLNMRVAALPEILSDAGYLNILSGK